MRRWVWARCGPQRAALPARLCLSRFALQDVVFVTGWGAGTTDQRWGERVFVCEKAPHEWLFKEAEVVVHHGGAGTTARALWAAVPSVVFPVLEFYDQPGWAALLSERKLGVRCGRGGGVGDFTAALSAAFGLGQACASMASSVRKENGVHHAAALLEGVAAAHQARRGGAREASPLDKRGCWGPAAPHGKPAARAAWAAADWAAVVAAAGALLWLLLRCAQRSGAI